MNNLKVENFVLFGGIFEDLSLSDRSEGLLQRDKGGARIYSSFCDKNPGSWNITRFFVVVQSLSHVPPTLQPHGLQHSRLPCPSLSPGTCSNSCPLSWWCRPTIPSSLTPFSSCPQSFPASGSFFQWVSSLYRRPKYWSFNFSNHKITVN